MTRVIVDELLRSRLHNLSQPLELCDERGRLLGRVFPAVDLSACQPAEPQVSEAELDRREHADETRYTTAEVRAHLERL